MPFKKGESGNPGGRAKLTPEARAARDMAREHSTEAVEKLIELMRSAADERVQKSAADSILDRSLGKPVQPISGDDEGAPIKVRAEDLSDNALADIIARASSK